MQLYKRVFFIAMANVLYCYTSPHGKIRDAFIPQHTEQALFSNDDACAARHPNAYLCASVLPTRMKYCFRQSADNFEPRLLSLTA
jgi:hypothetical protein